ncbi:DUF3987 domain-containing protein [Nonomuraea sp. NPDC052116]|uniref:DUF3987 domain-containing protein n=1 Tax=Nonomuraea sp. NPDC052116 TaxID=3155665 RepID=UPI00341A04D0
MAPRKSQQRLRGLVSPGRKRRLKIANMRKTRLARRSRHNLAGRADDERSGRVARQIHNQMFRGHKPRLMADDVTLETASSILVEQGGRPAVLSAEGGIFAALSGPGHTRNGPRICRRRLSPEEGRPWLPAQTGGTEPSTLVPTVTRSRRADTSRQGSRRSLLSGFVQC